MRTRIGMPGPAAPPLRAGTPCGDDGGDASPGALEQALEDARDRMLALAQLMEERA